MCMYVSSIVVLDDSNKLAIELKIPPVHVYLCFYNVSQLYIASYIYTIQKPRRACNFTRFLIPYKHQTCMQDAETWVAKSGESVRPSWLPYKGVCFRFSMICFAALVHQLIKLMFTVLYILVSL